MDEAPVLKKSKIASAIANPEDKDAVENNAAIKSAEVFAIDHILEQILNSLDSTSILTCRLVSHRFLQGARRPLGKRICKSFRYKGPKSKIGVDSSRRTFAQLTEFLEQLSLAAKSNQIESASTSTEESNQTESESTSESNQTELESRAESIQTETASKAQSNQTESASTVESNQPVFSFPCTNFYLYGPQLGNHVLQKFLNIYGSNIQKLEIFPFRPDNVNEGVRIRQLNKLLTIQAPNLVSLSLELNLTVVPQKSYSVECGPNKSNLKILNIAGNNLANTIEFLFQLSPKLQEVNVDNGNLQFLLQPVNRVHQLKRLVFKPDLNEEANGQKIIEKFSLENNVRLRELEIDLRSAVRECQTNFSFEKKVVCVINRLLEGSKDSLKRLRFRPWTFLLGMQMPSLMPVLEVLEIADCESSSYRANFPNGFSLTEAFPGLFCIRFVVQYFYDWNHVGRFHRLLNGLSFGGGRDDPVLSREVRKVILDSDHVRIRKVTTIPQVLHGRLQKRFPNASIEIAEQKTPLLITS